MKDINLGKVYCYAPGNLYLVPIGIRTPRRCGQQETIIRYIRLDEPEIEWNSTYEFALNNWDEV